MGVLQRTLSPLSLPTASTFNGGIYLLVAELKRGCSLSVGSLGRHFFPKGFYLYVGSAQTNLVQRLSRHLAEDPSRKRPHWHIDYLLAHARIRYIWGFAAPKEWECRLGRRLAGLSGLEIPFNGFGSSDCHCDTHLYYFSNRKHTLLSTDMFERVYPKRFRNFCYNNDRFSHT